MTKIYVKMQEERRDKFKTQDYPISRQHVLDGVEQVKAALASLKATQAQAAVLRQTALSNAEIAAEQAEEKLKDLNADAALLSVTAPFDGMVIYGHVADGMWQGGDPRGLKVGEKLAANQVVLQLVHPGKLQVETSLPENRAFWIEAGARVKVSPAAMPYISYDGTCGAVAVEPRGNPPQVGFALTIALPNTDQRLIPGMKASVKIEPKTGEQLLIIPAAALDRETVSVKTGDGRIEKRVVSIGRSDGLMIEIRSGLNEGDEVMLAGGK